MVVTGGVMTTPGWRYYEYEYAGKATDVGHQIAASQIVFPVTHGSAAITGLVDRLDPAQVFLYIPGGTTGPELGLDTQAIAKGRRVPSGVDGQIRRERGAVRPLLLATLTVEPGMLTPLVVFIASMPAAETDRLDPEVRSCPRPETC